MNGGTVFIIAKMIILFEGFFEFRTETNIKKMG